MGLVIMSTKTTRISGPCRDQSKTMETKLLTQWVNIVNFSCRVSWSSWKLCENEISTTLEWTLAIHCQILNASFLVTF